MRITTLPLPILFWQVMCRWTSITNATYRDSAEAVVGTGVVGKQKGQGEENPFLDAERQPQQAINQSFLRQYCF